jgi:hypothetical protein
MIMKGLVTRPSIVTTGGCDRGALSLASLATKYAIRYRLAATKGGEHRARNALDRAGRVPWH